MNKPIYRGRFFYEGFVTSLLHSPNHEWSEDQKETLRGLISYLGECWDKPEEETFRF